jgi:hypothetical protein
LRDVPCDPERNARRKIKRKAIYVTSVLLIILYFGLFINSATRSCLKPSPPPKEQKPSPPSKEQKPPPKQNPPPNIHPNAPSAKPAKTISPKKLEPKQIVIVKE